MATSSDITQRVRDEIYSTIPTEHPFTHLINGSVTNVATAVIVDDGGNFAYGDIIEWAEDGDQAFVQSVATNTLTVIRGWNGTTAAAHADNTVIYKNPRFTTAQITKAVTHVLNELETLGVHAWGTGTLTLLTGDYSYPVTETDVIDVVSVYYPDDSYGMMRPLPFRYQKSLHTSAISGGDGIMLWDWGNQVAGDPVYYTYKQRLSSVTSLMARQEEIVVVGATERLLRSKVVPWTQDPGKRTNRTIQPGSIERDGRALRSEYIRLAREESQLLKVEMARLPGDIITNRVRRWRP